MSPDQIPVDRSLLVCLDCAILKGEAATSSRTIPMPTTSRVNLLVPYSEKDEAKALGARWDVDQRVWYAPPGLDLSGLEKWLPKGFAIHDTVGSTERRS